MLELRVFQKLDVQNALQFERYVEEWTKRQKYSVEKKIEIYLLFPNEAKDYQDTYEVKIMKVKETRNALQFNYKGSKFQLSTYSRRDRFMLRQIILNGSLNKHKFYLIPWSEIILRKMKKDKSDLLDVQSQKQKSLILIEKEEKKLEKKKTSIFQSYDSKSKMSLCGDNLLQLQQFQKPQIPKKSVSLQSESMTKQFDSQTLNESKRLREDILFQQKWQGQSIFINEGSAQEEILWNADDIAIKAELMFFVETLGKKFLSKKVPGKYNHLLDALVQFHKYTNSGQISFGVVEMYQAQGDNTEESLFIVRVVSSKKLQDFSSTGLKYMPQYFLSCKVDQKNINFDLQGESIKQWNLSYGINLEENEQPNYFVGSYSQLFYEYLREQQ